MVRLTIDLEESLSFVGLVCLKEIISINQLRNRKVPKNVDLLW